MKLEEANPVALGATRAILAAAHPFDTEVAGTLVHVNVAGAEPSAWPKEVPGLDEAIHGPWPPQVLVQCEWEGGKVEFELRAHSGRKLRVALAVRLMGASWLGFINVTAPLLESQEPEVLIQTWFGLKKRRVRTTQQTLNKKLRSLIAQSGLPMVGEKSVELFTLRIDDASVHPSAEAAFERLVRVSLYKLDFFSRGRLASKRGKPLIDLAALGVDPAEESGDGAESEDEEERGYWAGAYGTEERLTEFLKHDYWQLGWTRDDDGKGAQQAWARFADVQVGDWFAITGFGGNYQLVVHYLGEVIATDDEAGRLELRPLSKRPLYKGHAPRGSGAGSWFDTLVPITRDDIVELLFGESRDGAPALAWTGPRNVILYGPPGTGKTHRLRDDIRPKFTRQAGNAEADIDVLSDARAFNVIAAALVDLGGRGSATAIVEHPWVRRKWQAKNIRSPVSSQVRYYLQYHSIAESETVGLSRRAPRTVFDKDADGNWYFPNRVPDDIAEFAASLRPAPKEVAEDFVFVTFHQSYAYEDFIEGIRPKTAEGDGDSPASLTYELEDGVFLRAANAAVRLAGFDGTVDDLCRRTAQERAEILADAPPYGVFVDEINRGNVSRIFGELITLLEEDKRLGAAGELIVTLPYSRRRFGVPSNLCLIGTMNTADRSVEALDSALRRRFSFVECPPDPLVLDGTVVEGGVDVARMLRTINSRLELLLDRDHLIGHAYFMPVQEEPTIEKLKEVFAMNILPLLSEYFYADLGRIGLVLGQPFVRRVGSHATLAAFDHEAADQLADRATYRLTPVESLSTADFRSIYETVGG